MIEDCGICLDTLAEGRVYTLNCKHQFHHDCVTKWLTNSPTCPLCRQNVAADQRYVDDGVLPVASLIWLKLSYIVGATLLESLFPDELKGLADNAVDQTDEFSSDSTPENMIHNLAVSALSRWAQNRLFSE
jgi:hypothetical protein